MIEKPLGQMGLRDLREIMRQRAPAEAWKHFNGAAETKATFHRNPRAFRQYLFRQKIFHDVSEPDISVELFGYTLPIPAITAPVGSFSLIGDDAEREVAEAPAGGYGCWHVPNRRLHGRAATVECTAGHSAPLAARAGQGAQ